MIKYFEAIHFHKYKLLVFLIIFLALSLRTYNFSQRWGLGSDDVRDISIAKEALERGELPLIGSFSSAGPFVFGPLFYWFIMLSYIILPFTLKAPWVLLTITGVIAVGVFIYIGQLIGGKKLSLVLGLLAATSPQLIMRSIALNQHSLIGVTTALLILFYILFWQKRKIKYALYMGLSLGIALSMHYQAINLFIFLPMILVIPSVSIINKLKALSLLAIGLVTPSLPLLIWDSRQDFANIRNILDYLLIGQYRIYVPNSWRLFIFNYLPNYWSFVEGGYFFLSFGVMFFIGLIGFILLILRKINGLMLSLIFIFGTLLFLNRYYRGERLEGYLMYLAPFIIIISGWIFNKLLTLSFGGKYTIRVIGLVMFSIILLGNIRFSKDHILSAVNREKEIKRIENILIERYPNQKISLYDYEWRTSDKSYPLSAFLKERNKISKDGVPIGIIWESKMYQIDQDGVKIITKSKWDFIVDLSREKTFKEKNKKWISISQERIYDDLMKWTKTEKLISSFSF